MAAHASRILAYSDVELSFCQVFILACGPFPLPQQPEGEFGSKWSGSLFAAGLLSMGAFSKIVSIGVSENSVTLNPMVNDHYPY